jgi:hypothetical protein
MKEGDVLSQATTLTLNLLRLCVVDRPRVSLMRMECRIPAVICCFRQVYDIGSLGGRYFV